MQIFVPMYDSCALNTIYTSHACRLLKLLEELSHRTLFIPYIWLRIRHAMITECYHDGILSSLVVLEVDNLGCHQWRQSWCHDNARFSMPIQVSLYQYTGCILNNLCEMNTYMVQHPLQNNILTTTKYQPFKKILCLIHVLLKTC